MAQAGFSDETVRRLLRAIRESDPLSEDSSRLIFLSGTGVGESKIIPAGCVLRLGRDPACEVPFDPEQEPEVSTRHAEIRNEGCEVMLSDLSSKNGTLINGKYIEDSVRLKSGDVIQLGPNGPQLCYLAANTDPPDSGDKLEGSTNR